VPLDACELEIDLFCNGLRVPAAVSLEGVRGVRRTRAGLGSGLEVVIPTRSPLKRYIWANVPVVERFVEDSPYVLEGAPLEGYRAVDERDGTKYPIELPREPQWYTRPTSRGVPMARIGVLQGTYLGIYINPVCAFWNYKPALNCRFCTTGCNVGDVESVEKTVDDVVETCRAAKEESGITFVHLNGGFQGSAGIERTLAYVEAIKERVGLLVGVQLTPERDFHGFDALIEAGADHMSFCLEFFDPAWFARICPGKELMLGQRLFLDAISYCASRMPKGAVSGEIIAGVEPIGSTIAAIEYITMLGAFPTICIFRPTIGSDMEHWAPPRYEDMRRVMLAMYTACRQRRIPIGAAPRIEVSLVVTPDDAALLAQPTPAVVAYEVWRRAVRVAARPIFAARMRRRRSRRHMTAVIPKPVARA
jgi:hypothetical protein